MKRQQSGFSAVGVVTSIIVITLIVVIAAPLFTMKRQSRQASNYYSTATEISKAAVMYYQMNCAETEQNITINGLWGGGLLNLNPSAYRQPWDGNFPKVLVSGWGTYAARVEVVYRDAPKQYSVVAIRKYGHVQISPSATMKITDASFISNDKQRRLAKMKQYFDGTQC